MRTLFVFTGGMLIRQRMMESQSKSELVLSPVKINSTYPAKVGKTKTINVNENKFVEAAKRFVSFLKGDFATPNFAYNA